MKQARINHAVDSHVAHFKEQSPSSKIYQAPHVNGKLMLQKDANVFMKPVNPTVMKCLDYFDIVKKPMDLGTIQKKFPGKPKISGRGSEPRSYTSPLEFRNDMRLVWDNCRLYNAINTPVRGMGEAMADAWEKKWKLSGIEVKWEEEQQRQNLEEQVPSPPPFPSRAAALRAIHYTNWT